jgi:catechol 2,3-dioxygenase
MLGIERVGHIVIRVSDMDAGVAFYRDKLGMEVTSYRPGQGAFLSFGTQHHDIALFQDSNDSVHGGLGLVHIALRIPGGDHDLRVVYDKLKASGVVVDQVTNHGMTHSVYFRDPDENTLEIYTDVYAADEGMQEMRTKPNYREPLDIEAISAAR